MNNPLQETKWSENVILVDADYVDRVAFNLIVNFERMIGRQIPPADLAKWIDCVALDGGMRPITEGTEAPALPETLVVMIHQKGKTALANFVPANYEADINGKAFKDHLGEFVLNAYPIEDIADGNDFFIEALQLICSQKEVKRLMVIPNAEQEHIYNKVRDVLRHADSDERRVTVFSMQPQPGGPFRQEILGYSLMAALGISADEIRDR